MSITLLKIGSDPEMFLVDAGAPLSSIGLIPGSKKRPFKISEHESVQVDNVAIEFNVKPSGSPEEFIESMNRCYAWAASHLAKIKPTISLAMVASMEFPEEQLKSRGAKMFGCDPDFNAWKHGFPNQAPERGGNLRSCGGHIHIGFLSDQEVDINRFVRLLDKNVGIYCAEVCGDERRRMLYGKAGAYREKPYGVEYRTPSIAWLRSEESIREVFTRVQVAINEYNIGEDAEYIVQELINQQSLVYG